MHRFVVAVAFCTAFAASSAGEDLRAAIDVKGDGKYAYQIAKWTVEISKPGKKKVSHSGNTVRVFERQPDGGWKTRVHMFNSH